MRQNKGFTLIELLVVVLIIGILSAVALPQYQLAVIKSQFRQMEIVAVSTHKALQLAYLSSGVYPVSFEDLDISLPAPIKVISDANGERYSYRWGYCGLRAVYPGNVQCTMTQEKQIGLEIFVNGTKACFTSADYTVGQKVCRGETNDAPPTPGATSSLFYMY